MTYRQISLLLALGLLALVLLVRLVMLYIAAPLRVYRRRVPRTQVTPITPQTATPEARAAVQGLASEVKPLGFQLREVCSLNRAVVGLHVYNPETHDHLIEYGMPTGRMRVFRTELSDGRLVLTSNPPTTGVFSRAKGHHSLALPPETDLPALYRAHQGHLKLKAGQAQPVPGPTENYLERHEREGTERQVEFGLMRQVGDEYRKTLRGAFLMTWRLLPPLKQLRVAANERTKKKALAKV
jgi:hypothetical protein